MSRRRVRNQRGMSESLQWALILPAVVLAIVGSIQAGIWLHARTVAEQAAAAGAESAAFVGGTSAAGEESARRVAQAGSLVGVEVRLTETQGRVHCVVTGRAQIFLDYGQGRVEGHATMVREPRR